jgi:hypothetical protein
MFNFKSIRLPALAGLLLAVFSVQAVATTGNEISLDGTWEIVFDHENIGREAEWQDGTNFSDLKQKREVIVPSAWELIEKDYEGVAFYRREFDVPTEWKDKVVQLQFGAVNYIAVLDIKKLLTPFLEKKGIEFIRFSKTIPITVPVLVTSLRANNALQESQFAELKAFIKKGGTVVYLEGTGQRFDRYKDNQIQSEAIPFKGEVSHAKGLWSCIPHLVKEHPIFDGLESGGAMRELYENVYPIKTIRALEGETLVASVAFTWFNVENNLHFSGPKESWWGADMAIVSHGKGRCLISELRILPNLGKDPVADKILFNMIRYFTQ